MRGLGEDFDGVPEAGWVLTTDVHGQGLGREAVAAAHGWFDAQPFGGQSVAMMPGSVNAMIASYRAMSL